MKLKPNSLIFILFSIFLYSCDQNSSEIKRCEYAQSEDECFESGRTCHWFSGKTAEYHSETGCTDWSETKYFCFTTEAENTGNAFTQYYKITDQTIEIMYLNKYAHIQGWEITDQNMDYYCTDPPDWQRKEN